MGRLEMRGDNEIVNFFTLAELSAADRSRIIDSGFFNYHLEYYATLMLHSMGHDRRDIEKYLEALRDQLETYNAEEAKAEALRILKS